jgi:ATP-dependent protease ClpP protease subunit
MCDMQGMTLQPSVTELLMAELLWLEYDDKTKPISMYINSTGVAVSSSLSFQNSLLMFSSMGSSVA